MGIDVEYIRLANNTDCKVFSAEQSVVLSLSKTLFAGRKLIGNRNYTWINTIDNPLSVGLLNDTIFPVKPGNNPNLNPNLG